MVGMNAPSERGSRKAHLSLQTTEPTSFGSGFISGLLSAILGIAGFGAVLCLRFPEYLSYEPLRVVYERGGFRAVVHIVLVASFLLGTASAFLRANKALALTGVGFTLLDSASATIDPLAYEWLDQWLAEGRHQVHVVAMHIPPLDPDGERNGAFASRSEASMLLAKLAAGGVDLTLYGHLHSFYAFGNGGIPAYISGGGGAIPERLDSVGRHFLVIDVDPGAPGEDGRVLSVGIVRVDPT